MGNKILFKAKSKKMVPIKRCQRANSAQYPNCLQVP